MIGKAGAIVKAIRDETGARIRVVEGVPNCDERVIVVSSRNDPTSPANSAQVPPAVRLACCGYVHWRGQPGLRMACGISSSSGHALTAWQRDHYCDVVCSSSMYCSRRPSALYVRSSPGCWRCPSSQ